MKKFLSVVLIMISIVFCFNSCESNAERAEREAARDVVKCRETVVKEFPNSIVYDVPTEKYKFIVVNKDGSMVLVSTLDLKSTRITSYNVIKKSESDNCIR